MFKRKSKHKEIDQEGRKFSGQAGDLDKAVL